MGAELGGSGRTYREDDQQISDSSEGLMFVEEQISFSIFEWQEKKCAKNKDPISFLSVDLEVGLSNQ